ncbi:MAG TPA: Rieske (2Fe-2S) protein [Micromonosporaceae bacterium]|jgi:Rieske Fe-S protein
MRDVRAAEGGASRRGFLLGAGAAGAAVVLAGCGGSGDDGGTTQPGGGTNTGQPTTSAPEATTGGAGGGIAKTSDIPVGGGKVFASEHVVITQPKAGTFKCFSSTCTHQGCTVESVSNGTINCPCHGSRYAIATGAVEGGPAPRPLPEKQITVRGGEISLA